VGKLGWIRVQKCKRTNACVICMYFMYGSFGANCQVLCYEHGLGDYSNIGFCFCLEVFGEGEYVVCAHIMYGWVRKGQKGELEFNHI